MISYDNSEIERWSDEEVEGLSFIKGVHNGGKSILHWECVSVSICDSDISHPHWITIFYKICSWHQSSCDGGSVVIGVEDLHIDLSSAGEGRIAPIHCKDLKVELFWPRLKVTGLCGDDGGGVAAFKGKLAADVGGDEPVCQLSIFTRVCISEGNNTEGHGSSCNGVLSQRAIVDSLHRYWWIVIDIFHSHLDNERVIKSILVSYPKHELVLECIGGICV